MKVSYTKLASYFEEPLPGISEVAEAFTFHTFEIDSVEGDVLDIKVLPNRANDCGTEVGIARQLSAILDVPLKKEFSSSTPGVTQIKTSLAQINATLGASFSPEEVENVFRRLRFVVESKDDSYIITPPKERTDLTIPVDIAEEVGQIMGYDKVPATELPPTTDVPDQARYRGIEKMKDQLVKQGYTEVSTQSFAKKGDVQLANPLDKTKPFLRTSLEENLKDALARAKQYAALVLAPGEKPKLFEVGTVFTKEGEKFAIATSEPLSLPAVQDDANYIPESYTLGMYQPFSLYPFITRDIAFWAPVEIDPNSVHELIQEHAQALLVRLDQFDRFEKDERISYGLRMVFQSMERTLTDDEVAKIMEKISSALTSAGYEIR